jgi:hypothetical protein
VVVDAAASNATSVDFFANGAYLGPAQQTIYGWLFTPDGGQRWTWDSAAIANGAIALTCRAVGGDGRTATSAPVNVTVANPLLRSRRTLGA